MLLAGGLLGFLFGNVPLFLFLALLVGFALGESSVISGCDDFSAFTAGDVKYTCERLQQ